MCIGLWETMVQDAFCGGAYDEREEENAFHSFY